MDRPFNKGTFLFLASFLFTFFQNTNLQFITSYKTVHDPYFRHAYIPWQNVGPVYKPSSSFEPTISAQFNPLSTVYYLPPDAYSLKSLNATSWLNQNKGFAWKDVNSKKYVQIYPKDKLNEGIYVNKIHSAKKSASSSSAGPSNTNLPPSGSLAPPSAPLLSTSSNETNSLVKKAFNSKKYEQLTANDDNLYESYATPVNKWASLAFEFQKFRPPNTKKAFRQSNNYLPLQTYSLDPLPKSSMFQPSNKLAHRNLFTWEGINKIKYETLFPFADNSYNGNVTHPAVANPTLFTNIPSKIRPTPSTITFSPSNIYLPSRTYSLISLTSSSLPQAYLNGVRHYNAFNWESVNKIIDKQSVPFLDSSYYSNTTYFKPDYQGFPNYYRDPLNKIIIMNYDNEIPNTLPSHHDTKHDYYDLSQFSHDDSPNEYTYDDEFYQGLFDNKSIAEVIHLTDNEIKASDLDEKESTQHFQNLTQVIKYDEPQSFISTKTRKLFPLPQGSFLSLNMKLVLPLSTVPSTSAWTFIGDYRFAVIFALPRFIPEKHRMKRSAMAYDRALIYSLFSDFLSKLGFDGDACLLRSVCEAGEDPVQDYGTLGELFNFILSPGYFHDDIHYEYTEAERYGILRGGCSEKFSGCPVSLQEILHSGISSIASMPFEELDFRNM